MAEPTEADRERAAHIVANWTVNFSPDQPDALENMISTYLADERARARAPFLALADEMADQATARGGRRYRPARTLWHFAERIRAAEETGQ